LSIIRFRLQHIIFVLLFILSVSYLSAQGFNNSDRRVRNTFSAGLILGANFTQMDGDFFVGFDKRGLTGGIKAYAYLTNRASLVVEILYTQKGANIPHGTVLLSTSKKDRMINLNYVEIPLLVKFKVQPELYRAYIEAGPVVSKLFNHKIIENDPSTIRGTVYNDLTDEFSSFEYNFLVGLGFDYRKFDISLRYNFGLSKLYTNPEQVEIDPLTARPREVEFLRNYHWGVALSYKL